MPGVFNRDTNSIPILSWLSNYIGKKYLVVILTNLLITLVISFSEFMLDEISS